MCEIVIETTNGTHWFAEVFDDFGTVLHRTGNYTEPEYAEMVARKWFRDNQRPISKLLGVVTIDEAIKAIQ